MSGYGFDDHFRKVIGLARDEAVRLQQEYVGTEHILLAIIRDNESVAAAALHNLDIDFAVIKERIEAAERPRAAGPSAGPVLAYSSRAKKVLELAMSEARELNHTLLGTGHLLLGLLREEKGIAAQVLAELGGHVGVVRTHVLRLLGDPAAPSATAAAGRISRITIELHSHDGSVQRGEFPTVMEAIDFLTAHDERHE